MAISRKVTLSLSLSFSLSVRNWSRSCPSWRRDCSPPPFFSPHPYCETTPPLLTNRTTICGKIGKSGTGDRNDTWMVWDRWRNFFFFFFQRKIVTCMHNRTDVIRWRITFFDVVLEESWNAGREYRYSTVVSHEISSMAEPFDDKRTLARRGWKSKCVHPVVRHRGTNSTN